MKLFPHIKKNIIAFLRNGKAVIISCIIFPMIMANIYGTMEENMFSGKSSFEPITVEFRYDVNSKEGEILSTILKDASVRSFINTNFKEEAKCRVTVNDDFKTMTIEKLKGSDTEIDMVKGFMKTFSESINQYSVVMDNVEKLNITSKDREALISKLVNSLAEIDKVSVIKEEFLPGYRTLGAKEYFAISLFSFTSIILIMVLAKDYYNDRKNGVMKRSFSTPNSKASYLIGYLVSSLIIVFGINTIYVAINRVLQITFLGSLSSIMFLVFLQSVLQVAVIGAIVSFIKSEQIASSLMTILIIISALIGGAFFNIDIIEINILKIVSDFSPNSLILNSYKNFSITGGLSGAKNQIVIMLILSLVFIIGSLIKAQVSWEE